MRLTVQNMTNEDQFYQVEIEDNGTVEDIKLILSAESNIDVEFQVLLANGKVLGNDSMKASAAGLKNDDMIMLTDQRTVMAAQGSRFGGAGMGNMFGGGQQRQQQQQRPVAQVQPNANLNPNDANLLSSFFTDLSQQRVAQPTSARRQGGSMGLSEAQLQMVVRQRALETKQYYLSNETQLNYILHQDPELGGAIAAEDDEKLFQVIRARLLDKFERERKEKEKMHRLANADVFDVEAQKQIEEEIRKKLVEENYEMAQENFPEFFGQITMLYINCKVNGQEIQAFVDSGAQSTIISKALAEKIGLIKLMDTRFAGMAIGVGSSRILGRVHAANMEILGQTFVCSFTVLEDNKVDFLFGLDNLKRHQCSIDLVHNQLHLRNGEISIPFLSEGEIKKNEFEEEKEAFLEKQKSMGSKFNEEDLKELMEVSGATRAQAEEALVINDGNKEHAANYLMSQSMARKSPQRK